MPLSNTEPGPAGPSTHRGRLFSSTVTVCCLGPPQYPPKQQRPGRQTHWHMEWKVAEVTCWSRKSRLLCKHSHWHFLQILHWSPKRITNCLFVSTISAKLRQLWQNSNIENQMKQVTHVQVPSQVLQRPDHPVGLEPMCLVPSCSPGPHIKNMNDSIWLYHLQATLKSPQCCHSNLLPVKSCDPSVSSPDHLRGEAVVTSLQTHIDFELLTSANESLVMEKCQRNVFPQTEDTLELIETRESVWGSICGPQAGWQTNPTVHMRGFYPGISLDALSSQASSICKNNQKNNQQWPQTWRGGQHLFKLFMTSFPLMWKWVWSTASDFHWRECQGIYERPQTQ